MNANDVLKYGNLEVERAVAAVGSAPRDEPGVVGAWSLKDVVGHLAAFEWVLLDAVRLLGGSAEGTPYLDAFRSDDFNDAQAAARSAHSFDDVVAEYREAHAEAMAALEPIEAERMREVGAMPWYGEAYSFDDLVVYQYYGHKREHCAQIALFLDVHASR